jgi:quercetin dioxygenase-like cupin family protein
VTVAEGTFDPGQQAPQWTGRHLHHRFTELCYVLEGDMTFLVNEEFFRVEAGGFVCIPPETVHAYVPSRERIAKVLFISSLGALRACSRKVPRCSPMSIPERSGAT